MITVIDVRYLLGKVIHIQVHLFLQFILLFLLDSEHMFTIAMTLTILPPLGRRDLVAGYKEITWSL